MATTTNYAWETPDDTDLVKDGAAAIRTLGSSIDTTTKALNPSTTLGDIEYRSSTANTNTRLGIGSTGNVLTVAGGVPTWAAPTAAGMSWVSVLARTSMGTGTSYTASSLSGYNQLMFFIDGLNNNGTTGKYTVNFNSDTGSNYLYFGGGYTTGMPTTVGTGTTYGTTTAQTSIDLAEVPAGSTLDVGAGIHIMGSNTAGIKTGYLQSGMEQTTNTTASKYTRHLHFRYNGTSVISSITITATAGNFDGGFMTIIGSVN